MQGVDRISVSIVINMESVIKSNTNSISEIVTALENTVVEKNKEIKELREDNDNLKKENKALTRKVEKNEEDIEYLVELNKPLEKAYRSLQRKYQRTADMLDRVNKGKTLGSRRCVQ